ncbi:MAG: hypothetical protein V4622_06715 [Bacteroidota bacterium]
MIYRGIYIVILFLLFSCGNQDDKFVQKEPKKVAQWINPILFNNDFEEELNFPLWFNDSLIKAHKIYKITKRVYPRILGDTSEINSLQQAIPKEKIEYYFDPNGYVDQIVIYSYFDDREISRANFIYEGNFLNSGYRKVRALPFISITKKASKDEFTTELFHDKTHQYSFLSFLSKKKKFATYLDAEKGNNYFVVKNKKNWGPLSIDSIVHPMKEDWIILGSVRKPYKRYQVDNIVTESHVHRYEYWKSGVLKRRIKENYPFEYRRTYLYGNSNKWKGYIDSTFSDGNYITHIENNIIFDEYGRPKEINHHKNNEENQGYFYKETLHYRALQEKD